MLFWCIPTIAAGIIASSLSSFIQVLFVTGCSMRTSLSYGTCHIFDHVDAILNLLELNNSMLFFIRSNFIAGPKNPSSTSDTWVSWNITIDVVDVIIKNDMISTEGINAKVGTLPADQEFYNI